jgi:hypothetical protein
VPKTSSNSVPPLIKSHSPEHSVPCSQQANSPQRIQQAHSQYHSAQQIPQCIKLHRNSLTAQCNGSRPIQLAQQYSPQHPSPPNGAHIPLFPSLIPPCRLTQLLHNLPPSSVLRPPLIFYRLGISGLSRSAYATPWAYTTLIISFLFDLLNLCHRSLNVIFSQIIIT